MTRMMIGGVTALALPQGLPIYADVRLLEMDYIILGAGSRSGKLKNGAARAGEVAGSGVHRGVVDFGGVMVAGSGSWSNPDCCLAGHVRGGDFDLYGRNGWLGNRITVLNHQLDMVLDGFRDEGDGLIAGLGGGYATWEVREVGAVAGGAFFDNDGVYHEPVAASD